MSVGQGSVPTPGCRPSVNKNPASGHRQSSPALTMARSTLRRGVSGPLQERHTVACKANLRVQAPRPCRKRPACVTTFGKHCALPHQLWFPEPSPGEALFRAQGFLRPFIDSSTLAGHVGGFRRLQLGSLMMSTGLDNKHGPRTAGSERLGVQALSGNYTYW